MSRKRKSYIALMRGVMYVCSGLTAALLLFLLGYVLYKGIPNISWEFLSTKPSHLTERIGILPDILNTVYIVLATLVIVLPLGVGAAIYLTEYAQNSAWWRPSSTPPRPCPASRPSSMAWWVCCCFPITSAPACWPAR